MLALKSPCQGQQRWQKWQYGLWEMCARPQGKLPFVHFLHIFIAEPKVWVHNSIWLGKKSSSTKNKSKGCLSHDGVSANIITLVAIMFYPTMEKLFTKQKMPMSIDVTMLINTVEKHHCVFTIFQVMCHSTCIHINKKTYARTFIVTLFMITENWNQPKCPSAVK